MRPLDGVRILDMSRLLPGPACSWYLAGLGASVDRVESRKGGDPARSVPPFLPFLGAGAFFSALAAGQRSLALDLRHAHAPALLHAILPHYDVLIEGFRPGVLEALGLAPSALVAQAPNLIVARISGFGQSGPWRARPGHDINYAGLAGLLGGARSERDGPGPLPVQAADMSGALVAAMGIAARLYSRERIGTGGVLDVSLTESALSLNSPHITAQTASGRDPEPGGEMLTGGLPIYGTYRCSDGGVITVGALEPKFQAALARGVGEISQAGLRATFAQRPRDEWVTLLDAACVGPSLAPSELADHPHLRARGAVRRLGEATFVRPPLAGPSWCPGPVPDLGEHTDAILEGAGVTPRQIAAWRAQGVVP